MTSSEELRKAAHTSREKGAPGLAKMLDRQADAAAKAERATPGYQARLTAQMTGEVLAAEADRLQAKREADEAEAKLAALGAPKDDYQAKVDAIARGLSWQSRQTTPTPEQGISQRAQEMARKLNLSPESAAEVYKGK